jgi:hypothetical protein
MAALPAPKRFGDSGRSLPTNAVTSRRPAPGLCGVNLGFPQNT